MAEFEDIALYLGAVWGRSRIRNMRDIANKMAELKFEAPLAQFEETDDWGSVEFQQHTKTISDKEMDALNLNNIRNSGDLQTKGKDSNLLNDNNQTAGKQQVGPNNFTETFSGSLEDLVNTFDDKITKCFGNYEESVEKLAPVQVRTQEEIMHECQMWWTITGNFGNILPIDWTKSFSRKMHMPALNLNLSDCKAGSEDDALSSEDEAVASDLDMHALILGGLHHDHECPVKTADEVIQEIDDMMQDSSPGSDDDMAEHREALEKGREVLSEPLMEDKLKQLPLAQVNEMYQELEVLIREFSETLIAELALRDELEYEKELKNTFISLLLAVQNKRRQCHVERKKSPGAHTRPASEPKYLTTVIPYHQHAASPDNRALQVLIKILKAINEDSPAVPALLTDYILKVLCPT